MRSMNISHNANNKKVKMNMIPKIIHLCWLSGDPFPEDIRRCLNSWAEHLSDYEVWLWGKAPESIRVNGYRLTANGCDNGLKVVEMEFDLNSTIWTKQAFEAKKYAFAADYIRLYALYNYGGIYLDADVLVYKSFDELLHLPYFIGCDQIRAFEAAVIGCEKGCEWIKDMFDTYKGKEFVREDGSYDMMELPVRFHHVLTGLGYKFTKLNSIPNTLTSNLSTPTLKVFNKDFFNSRDSVEVHPTCRSFCAHNYAGSWQKKIKVNGEGLTVKVKKLLPKWMLKIIYIVGQRTWARNKYSWFQIPFEK